MAENPLLKLAGYGQSIWLDFLRRGIIVSGELERLIREDGLRGVTSNPKIFEKAIGGSDDYDSDIRALAREGKSVDQMYQALVVEDIQRAADTFRPVYDRTDGGDGYISLEVSPHLARDTEGTIAEARRLWKAVDRPNIFIKIPGTPEGLPAIQQTLSEGININITLLFGLPRYAKVAEAYIAALETRAREGKPLDRIASVASFFLSRIDVRVDPSLEEKAQDGGPDAETARRLHGRVAIASAKVAYRMYEEIFGDARFAKLAEQGARPQRLLWASTSTKNPEYSDVKYVEALIGPATVNTVPTETLNAYRDHGNPAPRLKDETEEAQRDLDLLPRVGIDIDAVTQQLEEEGVEKFNKPFDRLMETLGKKRQAALDEPPDRQSFSLGENEAAVEQRMAGLEKEEFSARLWRKDPTLWKEDPEDQEVIRNALGWLHVAEKMEENLKELADFTAEVRDAGFRHVVHMGMGGSSLAPLVFERTFEPGRNGLPLTVLDTTDPATILKIKDSVPVGETLFIVASKSGTTAEPLAFGEYFYALVKEAKGERAGENFLAITDPGTPLAKLAGERGFRRAFLNFTDIGGRYSALSYFGLVPAALMGVDVAELLARSLRMVHACASCVGVNKNPAVALGAVIGELARHGRNKVTFLVPESVGTLGMWLEQLLAESTGKEGKGILPVAGEPVSGPEVYGQDRLFVYVRLNGEKDEKRGQAVERLREAGHPVVTIQMEDALDLGQEFFRWELATATAGAVLGINPFDQPNVQESKDNTDRLLKMAEEKEELPGEEPDITEEPLRLFGDRTDSTLEETLRQFLAQAGRGDYIALMDYLTENRPTDEALQSIRLHLRDGLHLATTLGYGPRFLHSTGQFHKGGPNTGLFLQLTARDAMDVAVPGRPYSFGVLKQAQALGDLEALRKHGRRVMRVDLGADARKGLAALQEVVDAALAEGAPGDGAGRGRRRRGRDG
jgi:transaldolase/glucose-6-phosphate isomerase